MKTNEDYLHLLEGTKEAKVRGIMDKLTEELRKKAEHALNFTDMRILNEMKHEIIRMSQDYVGRAMDDYAYHMIRAGINNILEHYELSNGIYQSRFQLREAWDEGAYYVHLDVQPRRELDVVEINIRLQ
jgi:hypothetical protein